jgi:hypothetical protein
VKESAEQVVKEIRGATRRQSSAEEKIRIASGTLALQKATEDTC